MPPPRASPPRPTPPRRSPGRCTPFPWPAHVRFDAPRALSDVRRRNRHQFLGLAGDCAVLEDDVVEVEKALEHVGRMLAKFAQVPGRFLAIELSHRVTP